MRPSHIATMLDAAIQHKTKDLKDTILLLGPPGCGKTSLVRQAVERNKAAMLFFQPLFMEPVDLTGVPYVQDGVTFWAPPSWIPGKVPEGKSCVVVLIDEITQCEQSMMKACAPLCEEHRIGSTFLPKNSIVVATGNRSTDRAGAIKLMSHVKSRLCEISLESSLEDFEEWGIEDNRIIPEVRYFLRYKPQLLNDFKPSFDGQYASQRGWHKVSKAYHMYPEHILAQVVIGFVGAAGNEFMAFASVWREMAGKFDVDRILASPHTSPLPDRSQLDVMWSIAGSIAEKLRTGTADQYMAAFEYLSRLPSKEFRMLGLSASYYALAKAEREKLVYNKDFGRFLRENAGILTEANTYGKAS